MQQNQSIKDLIKIADKHKLTLHFTSPIFFDGNNLKWYKDLKSYGASSKKNTSLFYKSWRNNFLSVIFGREEKKISNLDKNKIIKIKKFSIISKFIKNPNSKNNILSLSKEFIDFKI